MEMTHNTTQDTQRRRVYFNLHTHEFSFKNWVPGHSDYGRVTKHGRSFLLRNCTFPVTKSGYERTINEGKKYVHAYVQGYEANSVVTAAYKVVRISYNPKRGPHFYVVETGEPVKFASYVFGTVDDNGKPTLYAGLF